MRPWYQSGLQLLFRDSLPEQVFAASRRSDHAQGASRTPNAGHGATPARDYTSQPPQQQAGYSTSQRDAQAPGSTVQDDRIPQSAPSHGGQPASPRHNAAPAQTRAPVERRPLEKPKPQAAPVNRPHVDWIEPWDKMAQRVTDKVQIFWTYSNLAQDVSGQADPARRKLFQSLIVHMGLPKGSIAFWPCTRLEEGVIVPRSDVFWQGVKHFGVKFVACFGDNARDIIAPQADSSSTLFIDGVQVVTLSDPDFMKTLEGDAHLHLATPLLRLPLF